MASYSKIIQIGNLVHDPSRKDVNGKVLCEFSLATNFKFGDQSEVCYIDVSFWEKSAENVLKFFKKGDPILVEGELRQQKWQDKEGNNRSKHVIRGTSWGFVGSKGQDSNEAQRQQAGAGQAASQPQSQPVQNQAQPNAFDDDDIPF